MTKTIKQSLWISLSILILTSFSSAVEPKVGLEIGNKAPELAFNTPEGKEVKLSSLKGKVVLIDFWASWCRPCRQENPNVVSAYTKYSKAKFKTAKGFEIYGVSFDNNSARWQQAIKQDKLTWTNVSDLKQWKSAAVQIYKIRGIPNNVLIDENGIILAKNLRGMRLHTELDKLIERL